jgi:carbonic anhydrase
MGVIGQNYWVQKPVKEFVPKRAFLDTPLQNAILENVRLGVNKLNQLDPVIAPMVKEGKVKVVGGNYDLVSGEVTLVV